jgi:hypothetical protein
MKLLHKAKDGGDESRVTGYWLIESKRFFSVALLRFDHGSRDMYHNHAFNAVSWVLKGMLSEHMREGPVGRYNYTRSLKPIYTSKDRMHRVCGLATTTWVFTIRGPWDETWKEWNPSTKEQTTLTNGRKVVENITD